MTDHTECRVCGNEYPIQRWALGYKVCLSCGDSLAVEQRKVMDGSAYEQVKLYVVHRREPT
jgi:ribosomal protein L37AE/L43A